MRVYFDTEFLDLKNPELLSAGFVTEFGDEFYAELSDANIAAASAFVQAAVLPLLGSDSARRLPADALANQLLIWLSSLDEELFLISDSHWDATLISELYADRGGLSAALPGTRFQLLRIEDDERRRMFNKTFMAYFEQNPGMQHHALHDARAIRLAALRTEGMY